MKPNYRLTAPGAAAPWAAAISDTYGPLVNEADDELGALTLALLSTSKEKITYGSYVSNFARFAEYCSEQSPPVHPLEAHVGHVCRFVAWQGKRGTVQANSLKPYFSAINHVYGAHGKEPIADGPLVAEAVKGLLGMQERIPAAAPPVSRHPLPAQAAFRIFERAEYHSECTRWRAGDPPIYLEGTHCGVCGIGSSKDDSTLLLCDCCDAAFHTKCVGLRRIPKGSWKCPVCTTPHEQLRLWRDCLATVVQYQWINRADTTHGTLLSDLTVDPDVSDDPQIRFIPVSLKGKKRGLPTRIRPINLPVSECSRLAKLICDYTEARARAFDDTPECRRTDHLWALPGDKPGSWTSQVQNDWLNSACRQLRVVPPPGETYTSHSLRSGAASAACAIGVPMARIKWLGHWSKLSDVVEGRYIDPTFSPSDFCRFFFGWLAPTTANHPAVVLPTNAN